MRDGKNLRCAQNKPRVLRLRDSALHHAIVLKMENGSDLLLPLIWRHRASSCWLRFGTSEFQGPLSTMWYWRRLQRWDMRCVWCGLQKWSMTHIILDYILQRLGMTKTLSFDLKPSYAINIAFHCKHDAFGEQA